MSYCRWSSDGFKCDIYAYASVDDCFVIHVAAKKRDIPDGVTDPFIHFDTLSNEEFAILYSEWMKKIETFPFVDIPLPNAGQTYKEYTLQSFLERLLSLREEGFRFPDHVLSTIRSEIDEALNQNIVSV